MIMFRTKTSPQTVVTVQSAIPKLVIALILITFSYAIAGLLVDLTYVVLGLFAVMIKTQGNTITEIPDSSTLFTTFLTSNPLRALFWVFFLYGLFFFVVGGLIGGVATVATGGALLPFLGLMGALSMVVALLVGIIIIVAYVRVLWTLIKAFIQSLILVVIGPIYILGGIFPGGAGFGAWIRSLAAQLAVFPVVVLMLFFSHYMFWTMRADAGNFIEDVMLEFAETAVNPYLIPVEPLPADTQIGLPGFTLGIGLMGYLGAFGIIFLAPHAAGIIKSMIDRKPFPYGSAIGQGLAPVSTPGRYGAAYGVGYGADFIKTYGGVPPGSYREKALNVISDALGKRLTS